MDYLKEIQRLKKERNAIIVAHNYQPAEIQDLADFCGDSLELSRKAANIEQDVIVFCGVLFMAETAVMLSPEKTVLLPAGDAGCPMADMADADDLRALKAKHPNALVACYVNSTAAVKAESDICVTSSNAVRVIAGMPKDKPIIFVPDKNLGNYVQKQTGREMIFWDGFCPTHNRINLAEIKAVKKAHPEAVLLMHPECAPKALELADEVLSTGQMSDYVKKTDKKEIIVGTEMGIIHRLKKDNPNLTYYPFATNALCVNMKKTTVELVYEALRDNKFKVTLPEKVRVKAVLPIQRMLEY